MGFDSEKKRQFRNHAGIFSSSVVCLQSQSLDFTAVLPEIDRVIWNWGMVVRCRGTKRRQEDMGDYQPSSLSLQIWDKGFASRKEACTLKRFLFKILPDKHKHRQKKKKIQHTFHMHKDIFAVCLPTCLTVWISLFGSIQQKISHFQNFFKTHFQLLSRCLSIK